MKKIMLQDESLEKNRKFIRLLFSSDIPSSKNYFQKVISGRAVSDPEMELEEFISSFDKSAFSGIQLDWGADRDKIIYHACNVNLPDTPSIERYAWFECEFNNGNFDKVNRIFKEVYGCDAYDFQSPTVQ